MDNTDDHRFKDAFHCLQDCYDMMEEPASSDEIDYKLRLIALCSEIATDFSEVRDFQCSDSE